MGGNAAGEKQSTTSGSGPNGNTAVGEGMDSALSSNMTSGRPPTRLHSRVALRERCDTINPHERGGVVAGTQLHGNKAQNPFAVLAGDGEEQQYESADNDGADFPKSDGQGPATVPPQQQLDIALGSTRQRRGELVSSTSVV